MRDKAYVIKIDRGTIWVTPLLSDTCINCTHPVCTRRGTPFPVTNPLKLTVKTGDIVRISSSRRIQATQGVVALVLPILSAAAGYATAEPVAKLLGKTATEGDKAAGVLIGLFLMTGIITFISRRLHHFHKAEIAAVLPPVDFTRIPGQEN